MTWCAMARELVGPAMQYHWAVLPTVMPSGPHLQKAFDMRSSQLSHKCNRTNSFLLDVANVYWILSNLFEDIVMLASCTKPRKLAA